MNGAARGGQLHDDQTAGSGVRMDGEQRSQGDHGVTSSGQVTTHPNRLFMCLPATESGVTSVAPAGPVTRPFADSGGYRSRRQLNRTVVQ